MPETKYLVSVGIMALGIILLWTLVVPRWWRGEYREHARSMFGSFVFLSPRAQRGMYRAVLVNLAGLSATIAGLLLGYMRAAVDGTASVVLLDVAVFLGLAGLLSLVVGTTTVVVFNRPRFLVAPHVRHQAGLAVIWMRSCALRRSNSHGRFRRPG